MQYTVMIHHTSSFATSAVAGHTNPWLATAGIFAGDPMLEPMLQAILAAREAERVGDWALAS